MSRESGSSFSKTSSAAPGRFYRAPAALARYCSRYSRLMKRDSGRGYRRSRHQSRFHSQRISFARIHPVFCTSFVENNRHPIVNGFDEPVRSGRDDGEGSLPVARFRLPGLVKTSQPEQSTVCGMYPERLAIVLRLGTARARQRVLFRLCPGDSY
jgi:hypothetical protein